MSHRVMTSAENFLNRIRAQSTECEMNRNSLRGPRLIERAGVCLFSPKNFQLARPCLSLRGNPRVSMQRTSIPRPSANSVSQSVELIASAGWTESQCPLSVSTACGHKLWSVGWNRSSVVSFNDHSPVNCWGLNYIKNDQITLENMYPSSHVLHHGRLLDSLGP